MNREAANICGPEHIAKAVCLARGACVSHAPENAASFLISRAIKLAHADHGWTIFFAYADESAGELGSVYQACSWHYLGRGLGRAPGRARENFRRPDGSIVSERALRALYLSKREVLADGWLVIKVPSKHKYVTFVGPKAKALRAACRFPFQTPPKREQQDDIGPDARARAVVGG